MRGEGKWDVVERVGEYIHRDLELSIMMERKARLLACKN